MPANLTPQYLEAERRYREAKTTEDKIAALEEMMAVMPRHKGTDKLRAMLRRRMASLHDDWQKQGGRRRGQDPYLVRREGAGQVALLGLPNAGKSSLLTALTKAASAVAAYPFTTRAPVPGMMAFENVGVQLVDLPPLMDEASSLWLPRVLARADALALVLDAAEDATTQLEILRDGWREMGLDGEPGEGGEVFRARPSFVCLNKSDLLEDAPQALEALAPWSDNRVAVSCLTGAGLDDFRRAAFISLGVIRVYTKVPHGKADFSNPVILPAGSDLERAAAAIHKDFASRLKYARVWGRGFYDGQMVGREHVLHEGDVVEFHL